MGGTGVVGRRLSKPRTNTSSSNLLSWSDTPAEMPSSPITSSDMDYFGEQATTVSSQGERRSRRKSRSKLRAYLYGSSSHDSSQSFSSDEEEDRRNSLVGAARGAKKRLSRTGSSIMQLSSAKASTNYLPSTSSTNLHSSDPEEAVRVAEQIKERARLDKIAAQNHVSSPVDEDKHVDSVMAPLRRKSLFTPGLATRQSSDILRKPPPPQSIESQADRDYYYNPAYPASSPLAQLAALNHAGNGRNTPTMDVTHLGGLQLGTLRVTNGAASPVSQDSISIQHCQAASPQSNAFEDFQTASEGSDHEGRATPKHQTLTLATKASSSTVDLFVPTNQAIANINKDEQEPYSKRTSFPFQPETADRASAMAIEYASELGGSPFSHSETPLPRNVTVAEEHFEHEGMVFSSSQEPDLHSLRSMIDQDEPADASKGTREDAFSKLNGSSKASTDNKSGDRAPKTDSGYSSNTSLGAGSHNLFSRDHNPEPRYHHSVSRTRADSGPRGIPPARSKKEAKDVAMQPPLQTRPSFTVIPRRALAETEPRVTSTGALETISTVRASVRSPSQLLVKKLQKVRPKSLPPPPVNSITVQGYRDLEQVHIPRVPSVIAARHAERLVHFPLLDHTFPSSEHVSASRTSTLTQAYNVPIRFPSPANALESAAAGLTDAPVRPKASPLLPLNTNDDESGASNLVKSSSWSALGGGKQKKLQKKAMRERKEADKRLAKEEKELEKRLTKDKKEFEKKTKKEESKERSSRSRRSSWGRVKSSERWSAERDAQAAIADFGTVTETLGGGPYDVARTTQPPCRASQRRSWHPHQIGTAIPETRPNARMDTGITEEFSYIRGRPRSQSIGRTVISIDQDRADDGIRGRKVHTRPQTMYADVPPVPALSAVDLRHHDFEWVRNQQRSRSGSKAREHHQENPSFDDRGGVPGVLIQPQSVIMDAPPVPALPSQSQVQQKEADMIRSRPQSMVIDSNMEQNTSSRQSREVSRSGIMTSPRKSRTSEMAMPDLWTGGSLEKKGHMTVKSSEQAVEADSSAVEDEPQGSNDTVWEAQRQAWRERRKSAGEALLKNQLRDIFDAEDSLDTAGPVQKPRPQSSITGSSTADLSEATHTGDKKRPAPSPLAHSMADTAPMVNTQESPNQHPSRTSRGERAPSFPTPAERRAQSQSKSIPRKRVGSGASTPRSTSQNRSTTAPPRNAPPVPRSTTVDAPTDPSPLIRRLMGRYDGGLLYGYEPGQGLGGSAGTRSAKTAASRKSVEVSKGYGIDLSDIPVFVAPAMR